jgi:hypothetical protein
MVGRRGLAWGGHWYPSRGWRRAAASALAGERAAPFGVSVEVVRAGVISLSHGADGPVLQVGAHRVLLEGDGSAVATVEY